MFVIKLVEAHEQPASCAACTMFIDEWLCVNFPAVYDTEAGEFLCADCARELAPVEVAMLAVIAAGAVYGSGRGQDSPHVDNQLEQLIERVRELHNLHFARVFGRPEPDNFITSAAAN